MEPVSAQRTLVKSPPELWSKLSDAAELARHLEQDFGEIRITRLEAERTVVWEGAAARGKVELEASGWGTKVTLTAEPVGAAPEPAEAVPERRKADPIAEKLESKAVESAPAPLHRAGFFARILGRRKPARERRHPEPLAAPAPVTAPAAPAAPTGEPPSERAGRVLETVLDDLGAAHHRPFSRG